MGSFTGEVNLESLNSLNVSKSTNINTSILNNVDSNAEYNIGDHIYFDLYGEGVIVAIKDKILTVAFKHPHGVKMLIKGHKKIRKV